MGLLAASLLRIKKPVPAQLCLSASLVFFGYILLRALLSPVGYIARPDIYSVLGCSIVYLFVACVCTSPKARISVLVLLLLVAIVHVSIGVVQFCNNNDFMLIPFLPRYAQWGPRASGFYTNPDHLAGLLEVLGIFGISIVCWSRLSLWAKLLVALATGLCYVGLGLTCSRGGYLSSAVSLIVFGVLTLIVLRRTKLHLFQTVCAIYLVVIVMIGIVGGIILQQSDFIVKTEPHPFTSAASILNGEDDSTTARLGLWHAALEQWKLRPFFGTGSSTYLFYGRMFRADRMQQDPVYVHNDYLHLLAEYGAVGALLFLLFLGAHLHYGWKDFRRLGPRRMGISSGFFSNRLALNLGALSALAAYIVHSVVDFNLHIPANALLLAFVFGILANAGIQREKELAAVRMSTGWWRLLLPVIGIVLAIQSVRLLPGEYFAEHARTAQRNNHPDAAIRFALRGLGTERQNPDLYQYLASAKFTLCYSITNRESQRVCNEDAIDVLDKARRLEPEDSTLLLKLALAYDDLGRFAEGEWFFYEARHWDPKSIYLDEVYKYHLSRWRSGQVITQGAEAEKN